MRRRLTTRSAPHCIWLRCFAAECVHGCAHVLSAGPCPDLCVWPCGELPPKLPSVTLAIMTPTEARALERGSERRPPLIAPVHGNGKLYLGGVRGHRGGPGRPADRVALRVADMGARCRTARWTHHEHCDRVRIARAGHSFVVASRNISRVFDASSDGSQLRRRLVFLVPRRALNAGSVAR